ncbi:hypothetical protein GC176_01660 [bacterium]|nr:hypothetical protein [bacterium]
MTVEKNKSVSDADGRRKRPRRKKAAASKQVTRPVCGLVMPISEIDGCHASHWDEVRNILTEALSDVGFDARLVSESESANIIQGEIVKNLFSNELVVVDVSAKNPNVMFELGLRLAFDKPAVIVKDDETSYSFDTSPIRHLEYPRSLRYSDIVRFKQALGAYAKRTHEDAAQAGGTASYLESFGPIKIATIESEQVSPLDLLVEEVKVVGSRVRRLEERIAGKETASKLSDPARPRAGEAMFLRMLVATAADRAIGTRPPSGLNPEELADLVMPWVEERVAAEGRAVDLDRVHKLIADRIESTLTGSPLDRFLRPYSSMD